MLELDELLAAEEVIRRSGRLKGLQTGPLEQETNRPFIADVQKYLWRAVILATLHDGTEHPRQVASGVRADIQHAAELAQARVTPTGDVSPLVQGLPVAFGVAGFEHDARPS